ncbi:CPBP family intramembrane glutamic endopeptidase [Ruegeria sp. SCPT10]|uniref:CPBP family intramembrane glutamic endopeptidase n=1 Tax=Ruegeria sp. SCP10 TaxID=3141377 RepID=UPI0033383A8E
MRATGLTASLRNISIFVCGVMTLATLGAFLILQGIEAGGLLFVLSPALMALGLRSFGGDGWSDSAIAPNIRGNGGEYLRLILLFPVAYFLVGLLGQMSGVFKFGPDTAGKILAVAGAQAIPLFLFALAEEIGWRGYLYPKLNALGISAGRRDLIITLVWASWHIPYFALAQNFHGLPVWQFAGLFVLSIYVTTVIYGYVQERTRSIWPMVFSHTILGVLSAPFADAKLATVSQQPFLALRPEAIAVILIQLLFLLWLRGRQRKYKRS